MDHSEVLESNQALLDISEPCRHGHRPPMRKLRRQDSNLRDAINSRASDRSTTPESKRKERESNPQRPKPHRFSRRDTAPVAVLPEVAPAGVEPATRRLRVGSSAELSYGAMRCGRQDSNLRRVAFQATALPPLSYGHK